MISDEAVEAALKASVPGGSEVWCWLPQKDAWTPHETARDVIRAALEAALPHLTASQGCGTGHSGEQLEPPVGADIPTAADLDAIGAIGRKPTITKHRAANLAHIRDTVAALDAAGMTEAADTLVWSVWWRILDRQREELLLADSNRQIEGLTHD